MDRDDEDEDAGSEGYEQEFKEAEKEQAAMIEEYKASRRNTTEAKKEEEHNLAALGNYMTGSSPSHILHERFGRNTIS